MTPPAFGKCLTRKASGFFRIGNSNADFDLARPIKNLAHGNKTLRKAVPISGSYKNHKSRE
jgi:hypothetical protein